jgi:hypothetical protein
MLDQSCFDILQHVQHFEPDSASNADASRDGVEVSYRQTVVEQDLVAGEMEEPSARAEFCAPLLQWRHQLARKTSSSWTFQVRPHNHEPDEGCCSVMCPPLYYLSYVASWVTLLSIRVTLISGKHQRKHITCTTTEANEVLHAESRACSEALGKL